MKTLQDHNLPPSHHSKHTKSAYLLIRVNDGIVFWGIAHDLNPQYAMPGPGVSDVGQTVDWGAGKHDVHVEQYAQDHKSLQRKM